MKFSLEPSALCKALGGLGPQASNLRVEATVDGLLLETNQSQVFLRAQVAVAGVCVLPHEIFSLGSAMCENGIPVTVELREGWLHIGPCRIKVIKHLISQESQFY